MAGFTNSFYICFNTRPRVFGQNLVKSISSYGYYTTVSTRGILADSSCNRLELEENWPTWQSIVHSASQLPNKLIGATALVGPGYSCDLSCMDNYLVRITPEC